MRRWGHDASEASELLNDALLGYFQEERDWLANLQKDVFAALPDQNDEGLVTYRALNCWRKKNLSGNYLDDDRMAIFNATWELVEQRAKGRSQWQALTAMEVQAHKNAELLNEQAKAAAEQSKGYSEQAKNAELLKDQANIAAEQAKVATDNAKVAADQAKVATEQNQIATVKAEEAAVQAKIATEQAQHASKQVGECEKYKPPIKIPTKFPSHCVHKDPVSMLARPDGKWFGPEKDMPCFCGCSGKEKVVAHVQPTTFELVPGRLDYPIEGDNGNVIITCSGWPTCRRQIWLLSIACANKVKNGKIGGWTKGSKWWCGQTCPSLTRI
jgi:hypothetical protein